MMRLFSYVVVLCTLPQLVFGAAASDSFIVRTLVGDDSQSPTTPVISSVVPVASNQIDIEWAASTDDVAVVGYRVYRDGVPVATTSQTTYVDTGLSPETLYSYTVDAYDFSFNISSSSLPVATTTPPLPPVITPSSTATSTGGDSATAVRPQADMVTVSTTAQTARFTIQSSYSTGYVVRWGRTTSYELGTMSSDVFRTTHNPLIVGLEPGTRYFYEVTLRNSRGVSAVVAVDSFVTLPALSSEAPPNVSNVVVTVDGVDVRLSWQNPANFSGEIRVVRSHLFYPTTPVDGILVYRGTGNTLVDDEVLSERSPQYYTIFVQLPDGRWSSGALAEARRTVVVDDAVPTTTPDIDLVPIVTPIGDTVLLDPAAVRVLLGNEMLGFDALTTLPTNTEVTILIPKNAVMPHLKAIILTLYNPTTQAKTTSYLLKLDPAGEYYAVTFITSSVAGEAVMTLSVYDFSAEQVRRIGVRVAYVEDTSSFSLIQSFYYYVAFFGGLLLVLALWVFFLWWRRHSLL